MTQPPLQAKPSLASSPADGRRDCPGFQLGEVFLETMATGIITQAEIDWLTLQQTCFNRDEEAKALRLGRLLDEGVIQIGCRLIGPQRPVQDPLG
ncbi:MAG: hypothetical protein ACK5N0_15015 [Synechococcaceae cyanobacterium]